MDRWPEETETGALKRARQAHAAGHQVYVRWTALPNPLPRGGHSYDAAAASHHLGASAVSLTAMSERHIGEHDETCWLDGCKTEWACDEWDESHARRAIREYGYVMASMGVDPLYCYILEAERLGLDSDGAALIDAETATILCEAKVTL